MTYYFTTRIRWDRDEQSGKPMEGETIISNLHGFASVSRRESKKPFIAAVNGSSFGGGTEMVLNCDLVVASAEASFGLPEVKRGVLAIQGGAVSRSVTPPFS